MARLRFGTDEKLTCVSDVALRGPEDQPLCLAYKTRTTWFGGGVWFEDDGLVLWTRGQGSYYPLPEPAQVAAMQEAGLLPRPLPTYSVPPIEYAFGFSLWIVVAGVIAWTVLQSRRQRIQRERDRAVPISYGPPALRTAMDQWLHQQASAQLVPGETIQHQAFVEDRADGGIVATLRTSSYYAVLTNRRLLLLATRRGAFGLLRENNGSASIPRSSIRRVAVDDEGQLLIEHDEGRVQVLVVKPTRQLSNQDAFRRDLPRVLQVEQQPVAA